MKKIKFSLAALSLVGAICLSLITNANNSKQATLCSPQPYGGGGVRPVSDFNCGQPGALICCYRVPDNTVIYRFPDTK